MNISNYGIGFHHSPFYDGQNENILHLIKNAKHFAVIPGGTKDQYLQTCSEPV